MRKHKFIQSLDQQSLISLAEPTLSITTNYEPYETTTFPLTGTLNISALIVNALDEGFCVQIGDLLVSDSDYVTNEVLICGQWEKLNYVVARVLEHYKFTKALMEDY